MSGTLLTRSGRTRAGQRGHSIDRAAGSAVAVPLMLLIFLLRSGSALAQSNPADRMAPAARSPRRLSFAMGPVVELQGIGELQPYDSVPVGSIVELNYALPIAARVAAELYTSYRGVPQNWREQNLIGEDLGRIRWRNYWSAGVTCRRTVRTSGHESHAGVGAGIVWAPLPDPFDEFNPDYSPSREFAPELVASIGWSKVLGPRAVGGLCAGLRYMRLGGDDEQQAYLTTRLGWGG